MTMTMYEPAEPTPKKKGGVPVWVWVLIGAFVLVPVAVVGLVIIAAIALPNMLAERFEADRAQALDEMRAIHNALESYALVHDNYPVRLDILARPDSDGVAWINSPDVLIDPWDRPYLYERPGVSGPLPRVYTLGMDQQAGGDGPFEDLDVNSSSW